MNVKHIIALVVLLVVLFSAEYAQAQAVIIEPGPAPLPPAPLTIQAYLPLIVAEVKSAPVEIETSQVYTYGVVSDLGNYILGSFEDSGNDYAADIEHTEFYTAARTVGDKVGQLNTSNLPTIDVFLISRSLVKKALWINPYATDREVQVAREVDGAEIATILTYITAVLEDKDESCNPHVSEATGITDDNLRQMFVEIMILTCHRAI